ncbi:hypothetical protein H2202_010914, partial [Exophiala xenobiotica]
MDPQKAFANDQHILSPQVLAAKEFLFVIVLIHARAARRAVKQRCGSQVEPTEQDKPGKKNKLILDLRQSWNQHTFSIDATAVTDKIDSLLGHSLGYLAPEKVLHEIGRAVASMDVLWAMKIFGEANLLQ